MSHFQPDWTPSRRLALLAVASAAALAGCATATGPGFTQLEPPPVGKAHLYLYRKSALYASGAWFDVADVATKKPLGKLHNASYLLIPLDPGKHVISVHERGLTSPKPFDVTAEAGKTYFVEYDVSKGLLLGLGILSSSSAKTEAQALADLKDLKRSE